MIIYAKLFTSIYQGTLRGNSHGLLVFTNLLAHCDKNGVADIHPRAISEEVGLSLDEVKVALQMLESPDDESRSPEEQGRRIVRQDEHRAWGWLVVNYLKYRAIRDEDDRREQNRLAQERWRNKNKPTSADVVPNQPIQKQKQKQKEEYIEPTALVDSATPRPRIAPCPTSEILKSFHEHLPMLPQVLVVSPARKAAMSARWREVITTDKMDEAAGLEWFAWYWQHVAKSKFLTGRTNGHGGRAWKADFDWLLKPANFAKTVEGNYHKDTV